MVSLHVHHRAEPGETQGVGGKFKCTCLGICGRMAVSPGGDHSVQALETGVTNEPAGVTGGDPQFHEAGPRCACQRLTNAPAVTISNAS